MKYAQLTGLLQESGLSPEDLAPYLHVSNMTYRRWLKQDPEADVPGEYGRAIAGGVYRLVEDRKLSLESDRVASFLAENLPEFFGAVAGRLGFDDKNAANSSQQENIVQALAQMGANARIQNGVDNAHGKIANFIRLGEAWKSRVLCLIDIVKSQHPDSINKWVAYGALFYLMTPLDLIPDSIPVAGYIDDFGILGYAMAYYGKTYPQFFAGRA
jgi:uncharacterized membrane protein YkvA (DUF1232 family)